MAKYRRRNPVMAVQLGRWARLHQHALSYMEGTRNAGKRVPA